MANTWRATAQAVAYASGKSMIDLLNAVASTRYVRVYRAYHFNNGVAAVTGVLTEMRCNRTSAASAGTAVTPVAHSPAYAALNANTTAGTGRTVTVVSLLRSYLYSNDEPAVSGATMDEMELFVPFAEVWNAGYGDTAVEPITLPAGTAQGFEIKQQGTSVVGSASLEIEFTDAAA